MVLEILKESEKTWREIARLATPLDADKPVIISDKPRQGDFEAYTDNKRIYISVDENKFRKNFEDIVVPAYRVAAPLLYRVRKPASDLELLTNLAFDTFLFIHFHEQLHPWVCPSSRQDEKRITMELYEAVKKAEPSLSKAEAMIKANNSKNLIWDVVDNAFFLRKTSVETDNLAEKISFVFQKDGRQLEYQPITSFPQGILPIVYLVSAHNNTTDIPISLMGGLYATLSYNSADMRKRAMDFFLKNLKSKGIDPADVPKILQKLYSGFIDEIKSCDLDRFGIDSAEFRKRIKTIDDLQNKDYEENQRYFISAITQIFDTDMRYPSLRGFMKVLSPYVSLQKKQGSPDKNTSGGFGDGESGGETGKSEDDMDGDSIGDTLDDLLDELGEKEANDILEDIANSPGIGAGGKGAAKKINILAADEYYKRNCDAIEVRNASEEMLSRDIGTRQKWRHVRSSTLTSAEASRLNHAKIINFQKATGLPILIDLGRGFFKLNEYVLEETPLKSYDFRKTGIEIPDNWIFFQDSSSSMGSANYVGTGCKFDLLNRVKYGLQNGLYRICKDMKKDFRFGVVDFSDATIYKGADSFMRVYESRAHPIKEVSLSPQCGNTFFNSAVFDRIRKDLAPGRTIYTFVTDGEISGDTSGLFRKIEQFSSQKNNSFVFVEVQSRSSFGAEIHALSKSRKNVLYFPVSNIKSIKDKLSSVLIKYG